MTVPSCQVVWTGTLLHKSQPLATLNAKTATGLACTPPKTLHVQQKVQFEKFVAQLLPSTVQNKTTQLSCYAKHIADGVQRFQLCLLLSEDNASRKWSRFADFLLKDNSVGVATAEGRTLKDTTICLFLIPTVLLHPYLDVESSKTSKRLFGLFLWRLSEDSAKKAQTVNLVNEKILGNKVDGSEIPASPSQRPHTPIKTRAHAASIGTQTAHFPKHTERNSRKPPIGSTNDCNQNASIHMEEIQVEKDSHCFMPSVDVADGNADPTKEPNAHSAEGGNGNQSNGSSYQKLGGGDFYEKAGNRCSKAQKRVSGSGVQKKNVPLKAKLSGISAELPTTYKLSADTIDALLKTKTLQPVLKLKRLKPDPKKLASKLAGNTNTIVFNQSDSNKDSVEKKSSISSSSERYTYIRRQPSESRTSFLGAPELQTGALETNVIKSPEVEDFHDPFDCDVMPEMFSDRVPDLSHEIYTATLEDHLVLTYDDNACTKSANSGSSKIPNKTAQPSGLTRIEDVERHYSTNLLTKDPRLARFRQEANAKKCTVLVDKDKSDSFNNRRNPNRQSMPYDGACNALPRTERNYKRKRSYKEYIAEHPKIFLKDSYQQTEYHITKCKSTMARLRKPYRHASVQVNTTNSCQKTQPKAIQNKSTMAHLKKTHKHVSVQVDAPPKTKDPMHELQQVAVKQSIISAVGTVITRLCTGMSVNTQITAILTLEKVIDIITKTARFDVDVKMGEGSSDLSLFPEGSGSILTPPLAKYPLHPLPGIDIQKEQKQSNIGGINTSQNLCAPENSTPSIACPQIKSAVQIPTATYPLCPPLYVGNQKKEEQEVRSGSINNSQNVLTSENNTTSIACPQTESTIQAFAGNAPNHCKTNPQLDESIVEIEIVEVKEEPTDSPKSSPPRHKPETLSDGKFSMISEGKALSRDQHTSDMTLTHRKDYSRKGTCAVEAENIQGIEAALPADFPGPSPAEVNKVSETSDNRSSRIPECEATLGLSASADFCSCVTALKTEDDTAVPQTDRSSAVDDSSPKMEVDATGVLEDNTIHHCHGENVNMEQEPNINGQPTVVSVPYSHSQNSDSLDQSKLQNDLTDFISSEIGGRSVTELQNQFSKGGHGKTACTDRVTATGKGVESQLPVCNRNAVDPTSYLRVLYKNVYSYSLPDTSIDKGQNGTNNTTSSHRLHQNNNAPAIEIGRSRDKSTELGQYKSDDTDCHIENIGNILTMGDQSSTRHDPCYQKDNKNITPPVRHASDNEEDTLRDILLETTLKKARNISVNANGDDRSRDKSLHSCQVGTRSSYRTKDGVEREAELRCQEEKEATTDASGEIHLTPGHDSHAAYSSECRSQETENRGKQSSCSQLNLAYTLTSTATITVIGESKEIVQRGRTANNLQTVKNIGSQLNREQPVTDHDLRHDTEDSSSEDVMNIKTSLSEKRHTDVKEAEHLPCLQTCTAVASSSNPTQQRQNGYNNQEKPTPNIKSHVDSHIIASDEEDDILNALDKARNPSKVGASLLQRKRRQPQDYDRRKKILIEAIEKKCKEEADSRQADRSKSRTETQPMNNNKSLPKAYQRMSYRSRKTRKRSGSKRSKLGKDENLISKPLAGDKADTGKEKTSEVTAAAFISTPKPLVSRIPDHRSNTDVSETKLPDLKQLSTSSMAQQKKRTRPRGRAKKSEQKIIFTIGKGTPVGSMLGLPGKSLIEHSNANNVVNEDSSSKLKSPENKVPRYVTTKFGRIVALNAVSKRPDNTHKDMTVKHDDGGNSDTDESSDWSDSSEESRSDYSESESSRSERSFPSCDQWDDVSSYYSSSDDSSSSQSSSYNSPEKKLKSNDLQTPLPVDGSLFVQILGNQSQESVTSARNVPPALRVYIDRPNYKVSMCPFGSDCRKGDSCWAAHKRSELRKEIFKRLCIHELHDKTMWIDIDDMWKLKYFNTAFPGSRQWWRNPSTGTTAIPHS